MFKEPFPNVSTDTKEERHRCYDSNCCKEIHENLLTSSIAVAIQKASTEIDIRMNRVTSVPLMLFSLVE